MLNNVLITCSTDVCEHKTLLMFYMVNGEKNILLLYCSSLIFMCYFFCCLLTTEMMVNICLLSDDVGWKNHSCYDIPTAWHSKMVPSHIHTDGIQFWFLLPLHIFLVLLGCVTILLYFNDIDINSDHYGYTFLFHSSICRFSSNQSARHF